MPNLFDMQQVCKVSQIQAKILNERNSFKHFRKSYQQQKQPPELFFEIRCSQKFHKIHRKPLVPESLFNTVAGLRPANLLKKRLQHRCFHVNFAKFPITPFLQNTSGWLLLQWRVQGQKCLVYVFDTLLISLDLPHQVLLEPLRTVLS